MAILERFYGGVNWCQEQGNRCKETLHIRDWSEVFVVVAAVYSLRQVIQSSPRDVNALVKNPHFSLCLVLVGAEVRIRQLWVNYTLDEELQEFKSNNRGLAREVEDLTNQNRKLQEELGPLKKAEEDFSGDLGRLGNENRRLNGDVDRLQKEVQRLTLLEKELRDELETGKAQLLEWEERLKEKEAGLGVREKELEQFGQQLVAQSHALNERQLELDKKEEAAL